MSLFSRNKPAARPVDAVAEIDEAHQDREDDLHEPGHGRPSLEGVRRPNAPGSRVFFIVVIFAVLVLLFMLLSRYLFGGTKTKVNNGQESQIGLVIPSLKLFKPQAPAEPAPTAPAAPTVPALPANPYLLPSTPGLSAPVAPAVDPIEKRRLSGGLQGKDSAKQTAANVEERLPSKPAQDSGPLANKLQPLQLKAAQAGLVGDRDLILTQGSMIDCVQQTKFVTAQQGMITCYAPHDILSDSGRVVLIDAGTIFTGYQQGVLSQGVPRIGIVWSRMETPQGVIVSLDSPGTGSLGEAGLDGEIDTHFAQRFGAAILVSLVQDIGNWASNQGQGGNTINLGSTGNAASSAVQTVLQNSINIPPTMYRNQGGRIGIYVARDLDFSTVYSLKSVSSN